MKRLFPPLLTLLALALILELVVASGCVAPYLLPSTSSIARSLAENAPELASAMLSTAVAAVSGLVLSIVLGVGLAISFSLSSFIRSAVFPYAIFFQTVPIVAIAPVLVIWFGFGTPTVIASSFIVSVFPVIASTLLGLRSVDPELLDLFRLYRASRLSILMKLEIPYALPQILSGIRIAAGLAVIGAIVGEFVAGGGLGSVVDAARTQNRIDKVFATVLISSIMGAILVSTINFASHRLIGRWHASEKSKRYE